MTKRNWISDSLINLLVDSYPELPFRPWGSGATRRNVPESCLARVAEWLVS